MRNVRQGRLRRQLQFLQGQYLQGGELPLRSLLSESVVTQALSTIDKEWRDRIYPPLVTLWVFLGQVISADHSCRAAVARLIAHRVSQGLSACSSRTGAYCRARMRLPEEFFATITRSLGRQLEDEGNNAKRAGWVAKTCRRSLRGATWIETPTYLVAFASRRRRRSLRGATWIETSL